LRRDPENRAAITGNDADKTKTGRCLRHNRVKGVETKVMPSLQLLEVARAALPSSHVWGYLDPGTGSMLFQILVAGILSASFFLKSWVKSLRYGLWLKTRKS
jgi:hypothetical protein